MWWRRSLGNRTKSRNSVIGTETRRPAHGASRLLRLEPLEQRTLLSLWHAEPAGSEAIGVMEPSGGPLESHLVTWDGYDASDGGASGGAQAVIADVPAYNWHHGCGPTAAGMVVGYWDMQGYPDLIPGDSTTQTAAVNSAIASTEHYDDYSVPIDNPGTGILSDRSELGGAHSPNNCIADWMETSWSLNNSYYGWSHFSRVDDAIDSYCDSVGYTDFVTTNETWGAFTWDDFTAEIDGDRPMVFLVDTNADGDTDHFVTAIGYDDALMRYACYDTYDANVHWYDFAQIDAGQDWGIHGATYVLPPVPDPDLVVSADDDPGGDNVADDGRDDAYTIMLDAAGMNVEIYVNGDLATSALFTAVNSITVNGSSDNDTLTVDFTNGSPIPDGRIDFDGAGQTVQDTLNCQGGWIGSATYNASGVGAGDLLLDGGQITFTGLEPIALVPSGLGTLEINVTDGASHNVGIGDDATPADGVSAVVLDGGLESATFTNPSTLLRVNTASGALNDVVTLAALDSGFGADVEVNTNDGDDEARVLATPAATTTTVDLGAGFDQVHVGSTPGSLAEIAGDVAVANATGYTDWLVVHNSLDTADRNWTMDSPAAGVGRLAASGIGGEITYELSTTGDLSIFAGDGDDALTADLSGGVPVPGWVHFHGGAENTGDRLTVTGGAVAKAHYQAQWPGVGAVHLDTKTITFLGLEPIAILTPADTVEISVIDGLAHNIELSDDATPGDDVSMVTIDGGLEDATFTNPAGLLQVNAGAGGDTITANALDSLFNADVQLNGQDDPDRFEINATTGTGNTYSVDGGAPPFFTAPGDSLAYNLAGLANLAITGPGSGQISMAGESDVAYQEIEQLEGAGAFDLVVNANADPGGDNVANDGQADEFELVLNGNWLEVYVNGGLVQAIDPSAVNSILLDGSSDEDTFVVDNRGGLIVLGLGIVVDGEGLGANPGGTEDALVIEGDPGVPILRETYVTGPSVPNLPPVFGPLGPDAGIIVLDQDDVPGVGFPDFQGPYGNEQVILFDDISPIYDSTPAVQMDMALTPAGDTANVVDGPGVHPSFVGVTNTTEINDGGTAAFESIEFANKQVVTVNGVDGADTITVDNPNAADGLTRLEVYGNELTDGALNADDNAADRFDVEATALGVPVEAYGQGGDDVFDVESAGDVDGILGALTVDGGPGNDDLAVDDSSSAGPVETVTLTGTTIDGITGLGGGGGPITYQSLGGGTVTVSSNDAGHMFDVLSTAPGLAETELNTGDGEDTVVIDDGADTANGVVSPIDLNTQGNPGDVLRLVDFADTSANVFHMNATQIGGGVFGGAVVPGGIFGPGGILTYDGNLEELFVWGPDGPGLGNTYNVDATGVGLADGWGFVEIEDGQGNAVFNVQADQLAAPAGHLLGGNDGTDTFNVHLAAGSVVTGSSLVIFGDMPATEFPNPDVVNVIDAGGARSTTITYASPATQAVEVQIDAGTLLDLRTVERVNYLGDAANDDEVTLVGSAGDDELTVAPQTLNSALAFLGGDPFDGPPEDGFSNLPGVAGGGPDADLFLDGVSADLDAGPGVDSGLNVDGGGRVDGDRLTVYGTSERNLEDDGDTVDGNGNVVIPGLGAGNAYDAIAMSDARVSIVNNLLGQLLPVDLVTASFVQAPGFEDVPGLVVNSGFEANPSASGLADDISAVLSQVFALEVNGGDPVPAFAPEGDRLRVPTPAEANIFSDKQATPNVTINSGGSFNLTWSSIENVILTPGPESQTVNLFGDNDDPLVDQPDNFVIVGEDVDSTLEPIPGAEPQFQPDPDGDNEFSLVINGSAPIGFRNVATLNAYGDDSALTDSDEEVPTELGDSDTLELTPYADDTPQGWGIDVRFDEGKPEGTDGEQADLIILHTSLLGGEVSEDVVIQPAGPESGEIVVTNGSFGTPIVDVDYVANLDIIVLDDDGFANDTDTLTLRGTDPANPGTSGNETLEINFGAAGTLADPMVEVTDCSGPTLLYRLRTIDDASGNPTFSTVHFDTLGGTDLLNVTPDADVAVTIDAGDPIGTLQSEGDTLNVITGGEATAVRLNEDLDSGTVTVMGTQPVTFVDVELLQLDGTDYVLPTQRPTIDLPDANDTGMSDLDNVTNSPNDVPFMVTADVGTTVVIKDGNAVIDGPYVSTGTDVRMLNLGNGTHKLSAEASDAGNNESYQSGELIVTIDRTAPLPPDAPDLVESSDTFDDVLGLLGPGVVGTDSDDVTATSEPAFYGTAEANALVRIWARDTVTSTFQLIGEGRVGSDESDLDPSDGLGIWEVTVEPLADGNYDVFAELEDLAGNISLLSGELNVTIDTLAPQRPTLDLAAADDSGSSDLDDVTNRANDVPLTVTAEAGSRVLIKDGETVIDDFVMPAADTTVRLLSFSEDTHQLSAEAFDQPGGRSAQSEELVLVVDRTAPSDGQITVDLAPTSDTGVVGDNVTSVNRPAFVGTAEANARVRVFADDGVHGPVLVGQGLVNTDDTYGEPGDGVGTWEVTVEPLANGIYTITVEVEDLAGNITAATDSEVVIVDPFEPNDSIVEATVLGSLPKITLRDVKLHDTNDQDFFQITAQDTGKLVINAFFENDLGDVDIFVVDGGGNFIAGSASAVADTEHLVIPVVGQEQYFLQVVLTDDPDGLGNEYDLEIENFAAPVPRAPQLDPNHDSGLSNTDLVTFVDDARLLIVADLMEFEAEGIDVLTAAEANAGVTPGAAVQVFANGSPVGYADPIFGSSVFEFTFDVTADLDPLVGEWSQGVPIGPEAAPVAADALGYFNVVKAAVRIFDGQGGGEFPAPEDGRSQLSDPLTAHFDPNVPDASLATLALATYSDTGDLGDLVTRINRPAFIGVAEANTRLRLYAQRFDDAGDPIGVPELAGETVVGSDTSDVGAAGDGAEYIGLGGAPDDGLGLWEITVEPLADGQYRLTLEIEDIAGNSSDQDDGPSLDVGIDTLAPQRPTIDLVGPDVVDNDVLGAAPIYSDTGISTMDNVTQGFADDVPEDHAAVQVRVSAEPGSTVMIKDGEDVIDTFTMPIPAPGDPVDFVFRVLVLDEDPHPLSVEAFDAAGNRSEQSEELLVTIDLTDPDPGNVTLDLLGASDSFGPDGGIISSNDDDVTNVDRPAFAGIAEAGARIRLFAESVVAGVPTGMRELVGQGIVNSDQSDGTTTTGPPNTDVLGTWEITVEPLIDGEYLIHVEVEDLAGNITTVDDLLGESDLVIDTLAPQRPTIDLVDSDDTGSSDLDNVTIGDPDVWPAADSVADFRISAQPGSWVQVKDGEVVIDVFVFDAALDMTDGVIDGFGIRRIDFLTNQAIFGIPSEGPHPLSVEAFDVAGNRSAQAEELLVTIDTTPPDPSVPNMLDASDSGNDDQDDVTNVTQPAFTGVAEDNAVVRVFATDTSTEVRELVGVGVVGSDLTDGVAGNERGIWEVTIEPLADGEYVITTEIEDLAGNISEPLEEGELLTIWIDTIAPNTPYLDLVGLEATLNPKTGVAEVSDTGRHDADEITFDNTPTVTVTANDTIDGNGNPFPHDLKYRIYDRPGDAGTNGEVLLVESWAPSGAGDFVTDGFFVHTLSQLLNDDYDGTIDGTPLADGVHNLKLEVEDRAGNFSHDFLLTVTVDTIAPSVSIGLAGNAIDGIDPSTTDTGIEDQPHTFTDRITSDTGTGFWGRAEADAIVRLFVDGASDDAVGNPAEYGLTVAAPEDGNQAFPQGQWQTAFIRDLNDPDFFDLDGLREILVTAEDVAGNVNQVDDELGDEDQTLDVFLDTRGPQVEEVNITDEEDYDLFNPKGGDHPDKGPTPLVWSLDVDLVDRPVRGEPGEVQGAGLVDVVFIVDESGSMDTEHDFLQTFVPDLEAGLVANGVGNGTLGVNQYALVGFGDGSVIAGHTYNVGAGLMGTAEEFVTSAAANLLLNGGTEDGYSGINEALVSLPLRTDAEPLFVLVSDEDRDDYDGSTYADVLAALTAEEVMLHGILNVGLEDGAGNTALAVGYDGTAYLEEPGGLFSTAGGGVVTGGYGSTEADYVALSYDTEGIVADLNQLRAGGDRATSFAAALAEGLISSVIGGFVYPAANEILATTPGNIEIIGDANGIIPIESIDFIDYTVAGDLGRTTLRLNFFEPLPDDRFTLTVSDRIADRAGNALDGETNTAEPQDEPFLPSGDGEPGEDFVARFTVDSRPEIGTWSGGSVYVDTNGNFVFDPQNPDYTNRDITYTLGFASDDVFAGNFAPLEDDPATPNVDESVADGFDKLAAYGWNASGEYRWLIDVDNDGVADLEPVEPAGFDGLGTPVAGNFDGDTANGDEVGLFDGENWYLDGFTADRNYLVGDETPVNPGLVGYPIVGDFDGDGADDLGTFSSGVFYFDLAHDGLGEGIDAQFAFNYLDFSGVRERPFAADMNADDIDDLGLFVPDRSGATPEEGAEWYFLISDAALQQAGSVAPLDHDFEPVPFGNDFFAQFGDEYAAPVVGNFDPPVVSTAQPTSVMIEGTDKDDTFLLTVEGPGQWTVSLNGVKIGVGEAVTSVEFDGLGGKDVVVLTASASEDLAKLWPGHGTLSGEGYTVDVLGAETIIVLGGGGPDKVVFHGNPEGKDTFKSWPGHARFYGDGFYNRADSFPVVHAVATDGNGDVAVLNDDPAGEDTFKAWSEEARMYGDGFFVRVYAFDSVHGFATPDGGDLAVLYDDPTGSDTFRLWAGEAKLYGDGFYSRIKGFSKVHALGTPDNDDVAILYENPASKDVFKFHPGDARLYGEGFYNRVKDFRAVHAIAAPGNEDLALLYDDPNGNDFFKAWPGDAKLYGEGFFNRAKGFRSTLAVSTGGTDVADLYGPEEGATLVATPDYTKLYGPGFFSRAISFAHVRAHGLGDDDVAILYDAILQNGLVSPSDAAAILWLYDFESAQERDSDDNTPQAAAVDEVFTAYWERD